MDTELKSIRFPKLVVEKLDNYSKKNFGIPFSRFIVHIALEKIDAIKKDELELQSSLINSYLEVEEQMRNKKIKPLKTVQSKLEEWK